MGQTKVGVRRRGVGVTQRSDGRKWRAINLARRRGWEVRRFDPFLHLDDYLVYVVFPQLQVNCVLDVGAHVGEYAEGLRRVGYGGLIVSFEPVRSSFEALRARAAGDPNWRVCNVALGRVCSSMPINVMRTTTFSSMLAPRHDGGEQFADLGNVVDHVETVDVRRLDSLLRHVTAGVDDPRVYLKMDTQGFDLDVFGGADGCGDAIVALQSELSVHGIYEGMPDYRAALDTYERHGFALSAFYPVSRDVDGHLVELDCVMIRADVSQPAPAPPAS